MCMSVCQAMQGTLYENYSFDYSTHRFPLAYETYGNAVELSQYIKLNSKAKDKGGAVVLSEPITFGKFETQIEFSLASEQEDVFGFQVVFQESQFSEEDFTRSWLGYKTDYAGVGVYVFYNHMTRKWQVMTLQGEGLRSVLPKDGVVASAATPKNSCFLQVEKGQKTGLRIQFNEKEIITSVEDSQDIEYRTCAQVPIQSRKRQRSFNLLIATKNVKHRDGTRRINDFNLHSITVMHQGTKSLDPEKIEKEREKLLDKKLLATTSLNDQWLQRRQYEAKQALRESLSFFNTNDTFAELLFKHQV